MSYTVKCPNCGSEVSPTQIVGWHCCGKITCKNCNKEADSYMAGFRERIKVCRYCNHEWHYNDYVENGIRYTHGYHTGEVMWSHYPEYAWRKFPSVMRALEKYLNN